MVVTGEKGKKKEVFSQGILRENNSHVAVDVFIYVFVNEAPRIADEGVRERERKDNALNNTTSYTATFFPCRENRFEYLLFTQTSC